MTNANETAFPSIDVNGYMYGDGRAGLTKREYFAAMAMQGMLANSIDNQQGQQPFWSMECSAIAFHAVSQADALIEQLDKQP